MPLDRWGNVKAKVYVWKKEKKRAETRKTSSRIRELTNGMQLEATNGKHPEERQARTTWRN